MNQPEKNFWKLIKKYLPGDVSRIENIADTGTPDITAAYDRDYWIELKISQNLKKEIDLNNSEIIRGTQRAWHIRRGRYGTLIFILIHYTQIHKIIMYKYCERKMKYIRLNSFAKCKNKWPWIRFTTYFKMILFENEEVF